MLQVGEVLSLELPRLSINGWFHGPVDPSDPTAPPAAPEPAAPPVRQLGAESDDEEMELPPPPSNAVKPHNEVVSTNIIKANIFERYVRSLISIMAERIWMYLHGMYIVGSVIHVSHSHRKVNVTVFVHAGVVARGKSEKSLFSVGISRCVTSTR